MSSLADLKEINDGQVVAKVLGFHVRTLHRRREKSPLYVPNPSGKYSRRQVELIANVETGVYSASQAYATLQAEHDAKRAQSALVIAKARKHRKG